MKKIIIAGNGKVTDLFIAKVLLDDRFEICGLLPCPANKIKSDFYLKMQTEIPILTYGNLSECPYDIIFALGYSRLIPPDVVHKNRIINLHAGILPKYRGSSANAWAIMNGESYIGYSIHKVNEKMDDGLLYYIKKIPISYCQTYADVHENMIHSILNDVPDVLFDIIDGRMKGTEQSGERIYGHKFTRDFGIIQNYNVAATYIYNLYRCMAQPLGSGIKIKYGGRLYNVNIVVHGRERNICDYIGIPGMIVNVGVDEIWVKTLDNVIIFKELVDEDGQTVDVGQVFRIGNKLML